MSDEGGFGFNTSRPTKFFKATIDPVNKTALFPVAGCIVGEKKGVTPGNIEVTVTFIAHYK